MTVTTQEVLQAYLDCRKQKRTKPVAQIFEAQAAKNIASLTRELNSGEYEIGRTRCFVVLNPSPREVWAASFRDRVVHHLLYNRIAPLFIPSFSAASSACLPGRGTLYGSRRLESFIRRGTEDWTKDLYFLQMDVSNFFVSIQKDILSALQNKKITCPWTAALSDKILWHDPTSNYALSGDTSSIGLVPKHKSLFSVPSFMGLPIGNLPSQFGANVYMNVIDQYIDHKIKPFGYVRYVDDLVLVDRDYSLLLAAKDAIEQVLWERLSLTVNPKKTKLGSVYAGIDFVGRVIRPYRTAPRPRVEHNAKRLMASGEATAERITSSLGVMRQSKSYNARLRVCRIALKAGYSVEVKMTKVMRNGRP